MIRHLEKRDFCAGRRRKRLIGGSSLPLAYLWRRNRLIRQHHHFTSEQPTRSIWTTTRSCVCRHVESCGLASWLQQHLCICRCSMPVCFRVVCATLPKACQALEEDEYKGLFVQFIFFVPSKTHIVWWWEGNVRFGGWWVGATRACSLTARV